MISRCSEIRDRTMNRSEWSSEKTTDATNRGYLRTYITSIEQRVRCFRQPHLAQGAATGSDPKAVKPSTIVNLNTATVAELEALPGIGATLYRPAVLHSEGEAKMETALRLLQHAAPWRSMTRATRESVKLKR